MAYETKNYSEHGGEKLVIGGELAVTEDGQMTIAGAAVTAVAQELNTLLRNEGSMGYQTLELQAVVVEGDTITFDDGTNTETYEVKVLDQAVQNTADTAEGALSDDPEDTLITMTDATHGLEVGELILIGSEVMGVVDVDEDVLEVDRAVCGSTIGTHAQNQAVKNGLALADPGNIAVGFTAGALTNAVSSVRIAATFNERSQLGLTAYRLADEYVLFATNGVGEYSVTLGGTFDEVTNIWMGDWVVGTSPGLARLSRIVHTVTAAEAAANQVIVPVNFAPSAVVVQQQVAADNVVRFDGKVVVSATPNRVVLTDDGAADFTADDVITLLVYE